jgi:hypothetical protein
MSGLKVNSKIPAFFSIPAKSTADKENLEFFCKANLGIYGKENPF